jgi:ribosomal protein S16
MKIDLKTKNKKLYSKITVSIIKNNKYQQIDNIGIYNIKNNYILLNRNKLKYWLAIGAVLTKQVSKLLNKFNILKNEKGNSSN